MRKHLPGCGREIHKKGMSVDVKQSYYGDTSDKSDVRLKSLDTALKTLKRRMVQEGIVRDLRRKEYYESKGQIARRRKKEGERRAKKAVKNDW